MDEKETSSFLEDGGEKQDEDNFSVQESEGGVDTFTLSQGGVDTGFSSRMAGPSKQYTKLETISGQTIRSMLFAHNVALSVGVIFTLLLVIISVTAWQAERIPAADVKQPITSLPEWYQIFSAFMMFVGFGYLFALMVVYWGRIIAYRIKGNETVMEMMWVMMLTFCMVVYTNPFQAISMLDNAWDILGSGAKDIYVYNTMFTIQNTAFTVAFGFYVWCTVHSYRYLDKRPGILFYVPKVILLSLITAVRIYGVKTDIMFSEMPFVSAIRLLILALQWQQLDPYNFYYTLAFTILEAILFIWIVVEVFKTRSYLKSVDYMRWRSKQIGFRFFLYLNLTFYTIYWLTVFVLTVAVVDKRATLWYGSFHWAWFGISFQCLPLGLLIMLCSYTTVTATVNLSANMRSYLFFFWCKACTSDGIDEKDGRTGELEPITYRSTEPPSFDGSADEMQSNCFTMQTHVSSLLFPPCVLRGRKVRLQ